MSRGRRKSREKGVRVERKLQTRIKSFYVPKKLRNDDEAGNSSPGGFFFFFAVWNISVHVRCASQAGSNI